MNRFFAVLLTAILVSAPVPAYALRVTESSETGLEEQLRQALNSPDDLVTAAGRLVSTVLGLTPAVVRPEPSRRAGLEESGSGASGILEEVFTSLPAVRKSSEIGPEHTRRRARALRDFFRAHHSMSNMPENVGNLLMAWKPQRRNGPHIRVAVGLFQAIASYLDDPDPQVQADMQETLGLLVKMVRERLGADKSEMQEGIDETLKNLENTTQEPEVRAAAYRTFQEFLDHVRPSPLQILKVWESARLDLAHQDPRLREAAVGMVDHFLFEQMMVHGARFDLEELEAAVLVLKNLQSDPDEAVREYAIKSVQFFDQWKNRRRKTILSKWIALVAGARGFVDSTSADGLIRAQLPVRGATTSLSLVTASRPIQPQAVMNPALSVDPLSDASEDQLVIESNSPSDSGSPLKIVETRDELTIARPSGEPLKIRSGFVPRIREIRYNRDVHELILSLDSSTGVKAQRIGGVAVRRAADEPVHLITLSIDIVKGETAGLEEGEKEFFRLRRTLVDELGRAKVVERGPEQGYVRLISDSLIARQMNLVPKAVSNFLSLSPERAILRNPIEFRVGGVFYNRAMIGGPFVDGVRPITVLLIFDIPAEMVATYQSTMKAMDQYSPAGRHPTDVLELYHRDSLLINVGGALWELLPEELKEEFSGVYPKNGPIYQRMMNRIDTSSVVSDTPFGRQQTFRMQGITNLDGEIFAATFSWYLDSESIWKELRQPRMTDAEHRYFEKVLKWVEEQTKGWKPLPGTVLSSVPTAGLEEAAYEGDDWGELVDVIREKGKTHAVASLVAHETSPENQTLPVQFWFPKTQDSPVLFIANHWYNSTGRFQFRLSFSDQPEPEVPVDSRAQQSGKPLVHAKLEITPFKSAAGLEEVRVMTTREVITQNNDDLTQLGMGLESAGSFGLALLPKDWVDREVVEQTPSSLFLYAHSEVAAGIVNMELFPLAMLHTLVSLDTNPAFANQRLAEAVADEAEGATVVVGLDSNYYSRQSGQLNLKKINGMKLLLNPDTMNRLAPYQRQLLVFLKRQEALAGFILDLTSGLVRTVTLDDGRQYYALEIAA